MLDRIILIGTAKNFPSAVKAAGSVATTASVALRGAYGTSTSGRSDRRTNDCTASVASSMWRNATHCTAPRRGTTLRSATQRNVHEMKGEYRNAKDC